jgi:DNA-binding NarL/FixJ family response regulator
MPNPAEFLPPNQEKLEKKEEARERSVLMVGSDPGEIEASRQVILSQSPLYGVETASTGQAALAAFQSDHYDVVVMDFELPDMPGEDLVKALHTLRPLCPIIVMTALDSPDLALKVLLAGATDFLPKIGSYQKFLPRTLTTNLQRGLLTENLMEMYQRFEQSSKDEALLNRLIVTIHGSLDLDDIIDKAALSMFEEFKASRSVICTVADPTSVIRIARQVTKDNFPAISEKSIIFTRYHDLLLDVAERRPLVVMQDDTFPLAKQIAQEMAYYSIKSLIMVPLVYRGRLMGLLHLDDCENPRLWTQSQINLLSRIANQLPIAMSQAKLYQIVETQSRSIDKLNDLCTQLTGVVNSTRELTARQEGREKVRVKLSTREIEVLRKVAQGLSNKEIADGLHITEGTTEVHVSRLRKKLNLSSRAALVRYAYENHLC